MKEIIQEPYSSPDVLDLQGANNDVLLPDHIVVNGYVGSRYRVARRCAIAAAVLFGILAGFQVALASGLPWGEAAWGGANAELRVGLRVASGVQAVLAVGFALVVLRRAGHNVWVPLPLRWLPMVTRTLAGFMALGTLMNAASRSSIERAMWTPVALSLAMLVAIVAIWSPRLSVPQPDDVGQ